DGQDGVLGKGDVSGTVTDGAKPLEGVTVRAYPTPTTATTDDKGAFAFKGLVEGVYVFQFHLDGFSDAGIDALPRPTPPLVLNAALHRIGGGGGGPALAVSDQLTAGYGTAVSVKVTATGNGPFTYAWTQTAGPPATLGGADTDTVGFTTRDFAASIG